MDETKRKKLEARLNRLLAEAGEPEKKKASADAPRGGARIIRRRKGRPDFHIPIKEIKPSPETDGQPCFNK